MRDVLGVSRCQTATVLGWRRLATRWGPDRSAKTEEASFHELKLTKALRRFKQVSRSLKQGEVNQRGNQMLDEVVKNDWQHHLSVIG